jgi:predicted secreted protein
MKGIRTSLALALVATAVYATQAIAHDTTPVYDRINFQVSATKEVENDTLVAVMYNERSGQKPTLLADDVNKTIAWAVELAKKDSAIKVQTLNYRQEPLYKNQTITGWKVHQSIRLESTDAAALSTLIGELQQRLSIGSLQYTVSLDVRREAEDLLIVQALDRFKGRGKLISDELGRPDYRLVSIDINTSGESQMPVRMRAVAAMSDSGSIAPPTLEAGVQTITVQVSGSIELEVGR